MLTFHVLPAKSAVKRWCVVEEKCQFVCQSVSAVMNSELSSMGQNERGEVLKFLTKWPKKHTHQNFQIYFKVILIFVASCITEYSWFSLNFYMTCLRRAVTDSMKVGLLYANFKNKQNSICILKTLAIARYLINSSSNLLLLFFFFWFEKITFPWISNKN